MPEPGGEGEEPQPDAGAQARECAGAVALEAEVSLAGPHVSCREKVVELGVHRGRRVDFAVATPDFGGLRAACSQPADNLESII